METESPIALPDDHVLIRLPEVMRMTGLSRASLYRLINGGDFPQPVPLTTVSRQRGSPIGFLLSEVKAWVRQRLEARNGGVPPASM
ncbi:regulatory protein [Ectopseudomonas composti]|uniref:Regulatory protein n=1 Tax=Ectopseudomonas composti TaxID=658457 RepID=A0ABP3BVW5_9GAMM|nr:AlpA family phage regulatory protein [Pseudomonas composti]EZH79565.1 regulatory protein [Pseudomonas composti]